MWRLLTVAGLILVTGLVYLNSFPGAFHYDDLPLMLESPIVNGSGFQLTNFVNQFGGRPLTLFSFYLNFQLFGENPLGYHLVSIVLHLLAVVLVWLLVTQHWNSSLGLLTAIVFAIHPIQTQAVNYIWSRSMLLMAVLILGALLLVRKRPWLALLLFQLAIWSRGEAIAAILPLALLNRRIWRWATLLVFLNLSGIAAFIIRSQPVDFAWNHPDVFSYWMAAAIAFWRYLGMMVWPAGQSIYHAFVPAPPFGSLLAVTGLVGLLLLCAFTLRKKFSPEMAGFLWLMVFLSPSLLLPNSDVFNESRAYLAFAGFGLTISNLGVRLARWVGQEPLVMSRHGRHGWLRVSVTRLRALSGRRLFLSIAAVILPGLFLIQLAVLTMGRNRLWNDDSALWSEAAHYNSSSVLANYNLGASLARKGDIDAAEAAFSKALRLNPADDLSYAALGFCSESKEHWEKALRLYSEALKINPQNRFAQVSAERVRAIMSDEEPDS